MELLTELTRWRVALSSGQEVSVWADGYSEDGDDLVFRVLVRASPREQEGLEITVRTPSEPERVVVTLARFRREDVTSTMSD